MAEEEAEIARQLEPPQVVQQPMEALAETKEREEGPQYKAELDQTNMELQKECDHGHTTLTPNMLAHNVQPLIGVPKE